MTSPAPASSPPLRESLLTVTELAVRELAPVWRLPAADLPEALFDIVPGLVQTWNLAASSVAADWYDDLREMEAIAGRFTAVVPDLGDQGAHALAGWGVDGLKAPPAEPKGPAAELKLPVVEELEPAGDAEVPELNVVAAQSRIEGGLQKRLVNAANLVVTESANQDPQARGYMRRTRPGACDFCVMVASRGAVYTKASATFACHEHCYCEAVPAWGGKALPVGPYKPSDRPSTQADRDRVRRWIAQNMEGGGTTTRDGKRTSTRRVVEQPKESKREIAERQLPGLEKSLKDLRARGLPEDSPQIQYHLKTITKFKANL